MRQSFSVIINHPMSESFCGNEDILHSSFFITAKITQDQDAQYTSSSLDITAPNENTGTGLHMVCEGDDGRYLHVIG